MIFKIHKDYTLVDRDIRALSWFLLLLVSSILGTLTYLVSDEQFKEALPFLAPLAASVAALVVAKVANRLLLSNALIREDDRRRDVVRVTHHLMAIIKDLRGRLNYANLALVNSKVTLIGFRQMAEVLETRYEVLLDREAYLFLPGEAVDIITRLGPLIFDLQIVAEGTKHISTDNPFALFPIAPEQAMTSFKEKFKQAEEDLVQLLAIVRKIRTDLDAVKPTPRSGSLTKLRPFLPKKWTGLAQVDEHTPTSDVEHRPAAAAGPRSEPS